MHTVQNGHYSKQTVSKLDTVPVTARAKQGFTAVPNDLLRGDAKFADPLDFMIFMHMVSMSLGFHRDWATVGQAQLERFTGAAKNTVKRSLDRLVAAGRLVVTEEYEHCRMSRRWQVNIKHVESSTESAPPTVSGIDTVQIAQCSELTQTVSNVDTVTGSKLDTYKESVLKQKENKTLSQVSEKFKQYFSSLKPQRKRQSEWENFQELLKDFSDDEIATAFDFLTEHGVFGTGDTCHSPMAYLSKAIGQVLAEAQTMQTDRLAKQGKIEALQKQRHSQTANEAAEEQEFLKREKAFMKAFATPEAQANTLKNFAVRFSMLNPNGEMFRNLAISAWFEESRKNCT